MISTLVLCCAQDDGQIPQANGYRLLGTLSKLFARKFGQNLFHKDFGQKKNFALSSIYPVSFWEQYYCTCIGGMIPVAENSLYAFRACFLNDSDFEEFCRCEAETIDIKGIHFQILCTKGTGNALNCRDTAESLLEKGTASGAQFGFIAPTGFAGLGGIQVILPTPAVVFRSLLRRWQALFGESLGVEENDDFADVAVHEYALKSTTAAFKKGSYKRGFTGTVTYGWNRADEKRCLALTVLSRFALYVGLGYKTTMGLGQVVPTLILDKGGSA